MEKEELAIFLQGREYGNEITKEESKQAKENGLVVVFGYSDDCMELRGAINDEFGTEAYFDNEGNTLERCDDDCIHSQRAFEKANKIEGDYTNSGWRFTTTIPHDTFDIVEEDELYCRGIVFNIKDLK